MPLKYQIKQTEVPKEQPENAFLILESACLLFTDVENYCREKHIPLNED